MMQSVSFRFPILFGVLFALVAAGTPILRGSAIDPDMRSAVPLFSTQQAACSGFTQDHAGETVVTSAFTRRSARLLKNGTAVGVIARSSFECGGLTLDLYEVQVLGGQFKGQQGFITLPSFVPS